MQIMKPIQINITEKGMLLYDDLNCKHVTWVVPPALVCLYRLARPFHILERAQSGIHHVNMLHISADSKCETGSINGYILNDYE